MPEPGRREPCRVSDVRAGPPVVDPPGRNQESTNRRWPWCPGPVADRAGRRESRDRSISLRLESTSSIATGWPTPRPTPGPGECPCCFGPDRPAASRSGVFAVLKNRVRDLTPEGDAPGRSRNGRPRSRVDSSDRARPSRGRAGEGDDVPRRPASSLHDVSSLLAWHSGPGCDRIHGRPG
jgi:hypothetical protein